ncbi:MAG: Ig-like domain-containing protein [Dethiobacteria bacterium]
MAIKKVFSILLLALFFILPALTPAVNGEYLRPVSAETPVVAEQVASGPETAAEEKPARRAGGSTSGEQGVSAETLTIMVGYYGGPYHTKKVFTLEELWQMPLVRQPYTFIDSMPAVVLSSAVGVKITDILQEAGIDVNSVEAFHFYCSDVSTSWYESMPKSYLLDVKRYYYPRLPANWDYDTATPVPGAAEGAQEVEAILTLEDNWQRFGLEPDFSNMDGETRFRLIFGQTDTGTPTAFRSAKWIHAVEVMLGGTPPSGVTLDQTVLKLEVGSIFQLNAAIGVVDWTTDQRLQWESSDPSIVRVDSRGKIKVLAEGTATITVTTVVGDLNASCVINGLPAEAPQTAVALFSPQRSEVPETENGEMPGNSEETENSSGNSDEEENVEIKEQKKPVAALKENTKENLEENLKKDLDKTRKNPEGGAQPWRVYEMSPTAVALPAIQEVSTVYPYMQAGFLVLFCLGAAARFKQYRDDETKIKIKEDVNVKR